MYGGTCKCKKRGAALPPPVLQEPVALVPLDAEWHEPAGDPRPSDLPHAVRVHQEWWARDAEPGHEWRVRNDITVESCRVVQWHGRECPL